jgi:hypothetical protein
MKRPFTAKKFILNLIIVVIVGLLTGYFIFNRRTSPEDLQQYDYTASAPDEPNRNQISLVYELQEKIHKQHRELYNLRKYASGLEEQVDSLKNLIARQQGISVPLTDKITVQLYYPNSVKAESSEDPCSTEIIAALQRQIPADRSYIARTIKLLLTNVPTVQEKLDGFYNPFPADFRLLDAFVTDGRLTLVFDDPAQWSQGGSCRISILRAVIGKTARQFPEVDEIELEPSGLFQP